MGFKCGVCGKEHDELPMDLAFMKPEAYFTKQTLREKK